MVSVTLPCRDVIHAHHSHPQKTAQATTQDELNDGVPFMQAGRVRDGLAEQPTGS
jgi:hypothetical protein